MPHQLDHLLWVVSMLLLLLLPVGFAAFVWFSPLAFARWAKTASLLACAAGVGWVIITLRQPPLSMTRYPFLLAVSIKQVLSGIVIGIIISMKQSSPSSAVPQLGLVRPQAARAQNRNS